VSVGRVTDATSADAPKALRPAGITDSEKLLRRATCHTLVEVASFRPGTSALTGAQGFPASFAVTLASFGPALSLSL
jgi:hypothetical protein